MSNLGKVLRIVAIVLLGLTATLQLLGGIGTSCVAFGAENFGPMAVLAPYKWLYQIFVVATVAVGIAGIWATVRLARGKKNAYRNAVIVLLVGLVLSGIHMIASELLRGASAPTNVRVFVNGFVLVVFLLFRIPGIWEKVDFTRLQEMGGPGMAAGVAMIVMGILTLTVHIWAGPTHTWNGFNFADVWHVQLTVLGWGLVFVGALGPVSAIIKPFSQTWAGATTRFF